MEARISKYKLRPGLRNKNCGTGLGDWAGNQGQGWAAIIRARDPDANTLLKKIDFFFFKLGFTPCKAKQPIRDMELQERKHERKITRYRKSV